MRPDRTALLDRIVATGERRRRRRRSVALTATAAVAAVLAVPLAVGALDGDAPTEVVIAGEGDAPSTSAAPPSTSGDATSSTSAGAPSSTTAVDAPATTGAATSPTSAPPRTAPTPSTPSTTPTTAADGCRNAYEPACGPFRWDPAPAPNQPLRVELTADRTTVRVGEPVTVAVRATDPDAPVHLCGLALDATVEHLGCAYPACAEAERHGPWDPPAAQPGEATDARTGTYERPGTYTVMAMAASGAGPCGPSPYQPYGDAAEATITITVEP